MAFGNATFSNIGGAVADIFGGKAGEQRAEGYRAEAGGFYSAAKIAGDNERLQGVATNIKLMQEERNALKVIGGQMSDVAGYGFTNSGTALDLLADSVSQVALERQITGVQGELQENVFAQQRESFQAQGDAAMAAARAADTASEGSFIGGAIKGIAAIASLL
jgi:hypothetical protein